MAYTRATKLPDRYKVVFRNAAGARIRAFLTQAEFDRKDRDQYVLNAYAPTGRDWQSYDYWFVPYIETFNTPSGDLEPGMIWEGTDRHGIDRVVWRPLDGERQVAQAGEVVVARAGQTVQDVTRKSR